MKKNQNKETKKLSPAQLEQIDRIIKNGAGLNLTEINTMIKNGVANESVNPSL
jgi:hypothetical protein